MDNKFKKSKYAAIILASTMALSTVASVTPQAFGEEGITAKAADTVTADSVISAIDALDVTKSTYEEDVDNAESKYNSLATADDKKAVTNYAKLTSHKAIKNAGVNAVLQNTNYPTADHLDPENVKGKDADNRKINEYSVTGTDKAPVTKEVKDKKGVAKKVGVNTTLDNYIEQLEAFKKAYDKAAADKGAKTILADTFKSYQSLLKTANALKTKVEASYDAKEFTDLLTIIKNGGETTLKSAKALKVDKKGGFTIDGDKFTASINKETGLLEIKDANKVNVYTLPASGGEFTVTNRDEDVYEATSENGEIILAGDVYTISSDKTKLTLKDTTTSYTIASGAVTINDKAYSVTGSDNLTLTTTASDKNTFEDTFTIAPKSGSYEIFKKDEPITIAAPATGKAGIPLLNLDKGMDAASYKKLKAGTTKYSEDQIDIINALEAAYKAASNGRKAITAEDLALYKSYVADVKAQTALEKKLTSTDAKGVTEKINKLKYSTDTAAYEKSIKQAKSAYAALSEKYKKKVKPAVVAKLEAHGKAITIIKNINNLSNDKLAKAFTENGNDSVAAYQAEVDAIAKAIKGNKNGGTGTYFTTLDKKERSYVKNFKNINAINKEIAARLGYVKQKDKIDTFETALKAATGDVTLRSANDHIVIGDASFKIEKDKKSKAITLKNTTDNQASFTIEQNDSLKLVADELTAPQYTGGKTIKVGTTEYDVTYASNKATLKEGTSAALTPLANDDKITLGDTTYVAKVSGDSITLTKEVTKEVNEGTKTVKDSKVKLNGTEKTVTATTDLSAGFYKTGSTIAATLAAGDKLVKGSDIYTYQQEVKDNNNIVVSAAGFYKTGSTTAATLAAGDLLLKDDTKYVYQAAKKGVKVGDVPVYDGDTVTVDSKDYKVSISSTGVASFTDQFDPKEQDGFIVKNEKGNLVVSEHTAPTDTTINPIAGVSVIDFKGVTAATFATANKYTDKEIKAIEDAATASTKVLANKEAKKYVNKVDTTTINNLSKAVKAQKTLENNVLAKYAKEVKASTDLTIISDGADNPKDIIVSKYEADAIAAQAALNTFIANHPSDKAKAEKSYKTKFADNTAASKFVTSVLNLPKVKELVVTDKTKVEAARDAYKLLTAPQKKLVVEAEKTLVEAEDQIKLLEAEKAIVEGSATVAQYTLLNISDVTEDNTAAVNAVAKAAADALTTGTATDKLDAAKKAAKDVLAAQKLLEGKTVKVNTIADTKDTGVDKPLVVNIKALDTTSNTYITALKNTNIVPNVTTGTEPATEATVTISGSGATALTAKVKIVIEASSDEKAVKTDITASTFKLTLAAGTTPSAANLLAALQGITTLNSTVTDSSTAAAPNTTDSTVEITLPSGDKVVVKYEVSAS